MPARIYPDAVDVSVLMAVRRPQPAAFRDAVRSVLAQTHAALELIVVETASEIGACELLGAFDDPRIRYHALPADTPLARARNHALQCARAEFVAILDADDVAEVERLHLQREHLLRHPEIDVVGSALRVFRDDGRVLGLRRYPADDATIRRSLRRFNAIAQPAVMARRRALQQVGGYAERDDGVCEDYDLWCRMANAGARFANLDEPLVRYRIHDRSIKSEQLRATLRDSIAIKRRHFGGRLGLRGELRILGERALTCLPPGLVQRLFLWTTLDGGGHAATSAR